MKSLTKVSLVCLAFCLSACTYRGTASHRSDWDSGAQKEEAMLYERGASQDQRLNNQLPRQRPLTNQRGF
jgi:hypothetical protein